MSTFPAPAECILAYKCQNAECGFYFTQKVEWGAFFCPKCKYTTRPLFDYYRLFGLEKEFTPEQLKQGYKRLSLKYHPDKNASEISDEFVIVRKGYESLSEESGREIYDHELMFFYDFINGKTAAPEVEVKGKEESKAGLGLLGIIGAVLGFLNYYFFKDYLLASFTFLVWLTASLIWKDAILNILAFMVEIVLIVTIGYTLFQEQWTETLILVMGFLTYVIIKYNGLGGLRKMKRG